MIINLAVTIDDNAKQEEVEYALREAGRAASLRVIHQGVPAVDEEYDLQTDAACVQCASVFRSE